MDNFYQRNIDFRAVKYSSNSNKEKRWILTSYDTERSIEEKKIQKSSDLHTYLVNSTIKSDTDEVQSNIEFSSESFSGSKSTLKKSLEQQLEQDLLEML